VGSQSLLNKLWQTVSIENEQAPAPIVVESVITDGADCSG
jgi:hypothetical protein